LETPPFTEGLYLREKADSLQAGLLLRLEEFVEELPTGQSANLIETIKVFLAQIEAELKTCDDAELRFFCPLIDQLSEVLEWLDHAHTAQTPRAYVEILAEISRTLHGGAAILVTPTVECNYRISDEVPNLVRLTSALSPTRQEIVVARLPEALFRVRFPRIERENILNHSLFGHEFGHPIADEFLDEHEDDVVYQERLLEAQRQIEKEQDIADAMAGCQDETERTVLLNNIQDTLSQIHRRALVELVSDAIAVYLFGPSAIFASMDFFIREPLDEKPEEDEYYPPTRYRWRLMLQILKGGGYLQELDGLELESSIRATLNSAIAYLEAAVEDKSDLAVLERDPYTRAAYAWLTKTLPNALDYAKKRASDLTYEPTRVSQEVPRLLERLQVGVPPSEVGTWPNVQPVDWRSTLVASWLLALWQTLDLNLSKDERREALRTTHRLAVKGVEYIFLQRDIHAFRKLRQ
jgi:hypothetical protein